MSWKATAWAKDTHGHRSHGTKLVLMVLADYHDDERGYAWPSQARLAKDCEMGERTVRWCLSWLEEAGFITSIQKGNQHQPSHYHLNLDVHIAAAQIGEPAISAPARIAAAREPAMPDVVNRQFPAGEPAIPVGTNLHRAGIGTSPQGVLPNITPPLIPTPDVGVAAQTQKPKKPAKKETRVTVIDEPFRARMRIKFEAILGTTVDERIDECLAYPTTAKWPDKQICVQRWLRTDAERMQGRNGHGANGQRVATTAEEARRWSTA